MNLYAYANLNPLAYHDPFGLCAETFKPVASGWDNFKSSLSSSWDQLKQDYHNYQMQNNAAYYDRHTYTQSSFKYAAPSGPRQSLGSTLFKAVATLTGAQLISDAIHGYSNMGDPSEERILSTHQRISSGVQGLVQYVGSLAAIAEIGGAATASRMSISSGRSVASGLSVAESRSIAAKNIWQARDILRRTLPNKGIVERNQIIKAFELETFRVRNLNSTVNDFRYFDGKNALLGGRWSTPEWIASPENRMNRLALPNNAATRAASVQLQPGTTVFEGTVAPQLREGPNLNGGAFQRYNAMGPQSIIKELQ